MSERSHNLIYTIDHPDHVESVWQFAQQRGLYMYKTRVTHSWIAWVIEIPANTAVQTRFLLEFSNSVTNVMGVYYT